MIPEDLQKKIETFLGEKRLCDRGYAKPTADDIQLLNQIVCDLIEEKFEPDYDGDLPILFHLVDLTEFERPRWVLIRRVDAGDSDYHNKIIKVHMQNVKRACDDLSLAIRLKELSEG